MTLGRPVLAARCPTRAGTRPLAALATRLSSGLEVHHLLLSRSFRPLTDADRVAVAHFRPRRPGKAVLGPYRYRTNSDG